MGKSNKILVVDDNKLLRDVLGDMIVSLGYPVVRAESGERAIDIFTKGQFDIVFTDLGMDDMNGWELSEKIKQIKSETIVILLTGWGRSISDKANESPYIDFLIEKPFQFSSVSAIIEKANGLLSSQHK